MAAVFMLPAVACSDDVLTAWQATSSTEIAAFFFVLSRTANIGRKD